MPDAGANHINVFVVDENNIAIADAKVTLFIDGDEVGWVTSKGVFDSPPGFDIPSVIDEVSIRVEFRDEFHDYVETKRIDAKVRNVTFRVMQAKPARRAASKPIILFIHGLGGDSSITWGKFPELIKDDAALRHFGIDYYGYYTKAVRIPFVNYIPLYHPRPLKIQTLADGLRAEIDITYKDHDEIILVGHSLGGLVARRYLIEEAKRKKTAPLRVTKLALYASPNNGADLAKVGGLFSWKNRQLQQLCKDADMIQTINEDWAVMGMAGRFKIVYAVGGQDNVVDEYSAKGFWGNPNVYTIVDAGHIDIVKPTDAKGLRFTILRNLLLDES